MILVEFAITLMQTLDTINRESFQRFKLRMGLNHGPVIAGVIGNFTHDLVMNINFEEFYPFFQAHKNLNMIFGRIRVSLPFSYKLS